MRHQTFESADDFFNEALRIDDQVRHECDPALIMYLNRECEWWLQEAARLERLTSMWRVLARRC